MKVSFCFHRKNAIAFSSDDKRIVEGSRRGGNHVRVWDVASGEMLGSFDGHTDLITTVAFSQNGEMVASGSWDKTVRVWDVKTGEALFVLKGHTEDIADIEFCFDDSAVVTTAADNSVRFWELETGTEVITWNPPVETYFTAIAITPDHATCATASEYNSIDIWDLQAGEVVHTLEGHTLPPGVLKFNDDGTRLLSGSPDRSVRIWDVETGRQIDVLHGHRSEVRAVQFTADETQVISAEVNYRMRTWTAYPKPTSIQVREFTRDFRTVQFSPDGTQLMLCAFSGDIKVRDAAGSADAKFLTTIKGGAWHARYNAQGNMIVAPSSEELSAYVHDANTGELLATLKDENFLTAADYGPNGNFLCTAAYDGVVMLRHAETSDILNILFQDVEDDQQSIDLICFNPEGTRLCIGNGKLGRIEIRDLINEGKLVQTIILPDAKLKSICFSSDGQTLITGGGNSRIDLWDVTTGRLLRTFDEQTGAVNSIVYSPTEDRFITGTEDGTVRIWDPEHGLMLTIEASTEGISCVDINPAGDRIAASSNAGTLFLWDAGSASE